MAGTLITFTCLLLMSSWSQTRGEIVKSVGHIKQVKNSDVIECNFNGVVRLSHVNFNNTKGEHVFAIVNCAASCKVHIIYQDRLRIVSPDNKSWGNSFVFELLGSEMSAGSYTCYGLPTPHVVAPVSTRDHDADGEESQTKTLVLQPEAGGSSNGLAALVIIPILLLIGVLLFLLRRLGIQIPCLRETSVVQEPLNNGQEEETPDYEALLDNGVDNTPLHHGAAQRSNVLRANSPDFSLQLVDDRIDEGQDDEVSGVKEHQALVRVSFNNVDYTKNKNAGVEMHQELTHSSFSKAEKEQTKEEMEKNDCKEDDDYEVKSDAVRENIVETRAKRVQTREELEKRVCNEDDDYETASDDDADDADRSKNNNGAGDVDKLDGASSTGQNLVDTDQSNPEQSQECSNDEKRQTIRGRLKALSSKFVDDNSLECSDGEKRLTIRSRLIALSNKLRELNDDNSLDL